MLKRHGNYRNQLGHHRHGNYRNQLGAADADTIRSLNENLNTFKKSLLGLIKQRAILISQREKMRFDLFVTWKSKFEAAVSAVSLNLGKLNTDALTLFNLCIGEYKAGLPIYSMDGSSLTGGVSAWSDACGYGCTAIVGYNSRRSVSPINSNGGPAPVLNFFSNSNDILFKSFSPASGAGYDKPAYKLYPPSYDGSPGSSDLGTLLERYFLRQNFSSIYNYPSNQVLNPTFPPPPSKAFLQALIDWMNYSTMGYNVSQELRDKLTAQIPLVQQKFDEILGADSLTNLIVICKNLVVDLISKTIEMVQTQKTIDRTQDNLAGFLKDYNSYAESPITLEDIMAQLNRDAVAPPPPTVIEPIVVPIEEPPPPKKSNAGIIAAALGVGAFLLTKGK